MRKITKREYLACLLQFKTDWIQSSLNQPSSDMLKWPVSLKLHAIALRRKGIV